VNIRTNRLAKALIVAATLGLVIAPSAIASDLTDIGYVDQAAIAGLPPFVTANAELAQYQQQLYAAADAAMKKATNDGERQQIQMQVQQQMQDRQHELEGPILERAQLAVATVSSQKNLSVVLDKRIVIYGGQDITKDVIATLKSGQALAQPSGTPPPSEIGYVDQTGLDNVPKIKSANDDLQTFAIGQKAIFSAKMQGAHSDAEQKQIASDYQKTLNDKQDQILKPLADQVKHITGDVAAKHSLLLVVDRGDIVYGGLDITQDVQNALGK
jgi:outer membrane protein